MAAAPRPEHVPEFMLDALRDPRLRRHHAASVFGEIYGQLRFDGEACVVKIRQTALTLRIEPRDVRCALTLLEQQRYIRFSHRDGNGRRHYWLFENRGAPRPPVAL